MPFGIRSLLLRGKTSDITGAPNIRTIKPTYKITEEEDGVRLEIDMPGVPTEHASVDAVGDKLLARGTRFAALDPELGPNSSETPTALAYYALEMDIDRRAEVDAMRATIENGVVTVWIPMRMFTVTRKIPIHS